MLASRSHVSEGELNPQCADQRFWRTGRRSCARGRRTLHATLDWSYQLLDPGEQTLFARMSVFTGGACLDAVKGFFALKLGAG